MTVDFTSPEIKDLIEALNAKKALIIAGAGVTSATVSSRQRKLFGSWTSLLDYGLQFCREHCGMTTDWEERSRQLLNQPSTPLESLLTLGDEIWDSLVAHDKLEQWLSMFRHADRENTDLVRGIQKLGIPIATANYDSLLEDITLLTPITLLEKDFGKVQQFADTAEPLRYILHLHGYYQEPGSIILGKKSYDAILKNEYAQTVNRALAFHFRAIIFVGFGKGVSDPNFDLIFQWVSQYFPHTKLYHLVTNDTAPEAKEMHRQKEHRNVIVVEYGREYDDLPDFLRNLEASIDKIRDIPATLPAKPECIGKQRQKMIKEITSYLGKISKKPVGIIGTGGIGKTNLVLNVAHQPEMVKKFGKHRYFIRCEEAPSADVLYALLINALDIPLGSVKDPALAILNHFQTMEEDTLIVLDNFETPLDRDQQQVETFVQRLQEFTYLVFTIRGGYAPPGLNSETYKTELLQAEEAERLFHLHSDKKFTGNPLVKKIVQNLDCLPLAVSLMAKRAKSVERLETLVREWQVKHNELLKLKGGDKKKDLNLDLSIQLSYESPRLEDDERGFLKAICHFPAGIRREHLNSIFDNTFELLDRLKYTGLIEEDITERIVILAPIREYIVRQATLGEHYLGRIISFYLQMTREQGENIAINAYAAKILQSEWPNIIIALDDTIDSERGIRALLAVTVYSRITGISLGDLVQRASAAAVQLNLPYLQANCIYQQAKTAFIRSQNSEAEEGFNRALLLYEQIGNVIGKANCVESLGNIAFKKSHYDHAEQYFRQALPLYEQVESLIGKANCLKSLGDLAFRQFHKEEAKQYFHQALALYEEKGNLLGKANCLQGLGVLAFYQLDNEEGKQLFRQALPLYEQVGDLLGKANCLQNLGDLALRQSHNDEAEQFFRQALPLYEQVGDPLGKANCLLSLGSFELKKENYDQAEDLYSRAYNYYQTINSLYSQGRALLQLGRLHQQKGDTERARSYFCSTRKLWLEIGLPHLVKEYDLAKWECP